jgi:hypothetical protein
VQEALKLNQAIGEGLRAVEPRLAHLHAELFARDAGMAGAAAAGGPSPLAAAAPGAPGGGAPHDESGASGRDGDDDAFFMA